MNTEFSRRVDPLSQLPPHIAVQYAYLRRTAELAEAFADTILLARDFVRAITRALTGRTAAPANLATKASPLPNVMERPVAKAANNNPATPRIA